MTGATQNLTRIPCTIVTGFLGAGKTTLIRHVIANAQGRRLAVIVNEFGDVGIDGEILKGCGNDACPEENIVELANGCLCCTVADEFVPALDAILAREGVEHIVIETSGLALPKPLVQAFHWPAIKNRVTVDGVVVVVDGAALADGRVAADLEALAAQRAADSALVHDDPVEEVFEDQIACADLVVLNKRDLIDDAGMQKALAAIADALPRSVKVITAADGKVDQALLLGLGIATEDDIANRRTHHDDEADHDHDDFDSFVVPIGEIADPAALAQRVAGARRRVRRAARQRFCRRRRQADAPHGAGGRPAGEPSIRPAVDRHRGARRPPRRDRPQRPRPRRGDARARAAEQTKRNPAMHLLATSSTTLDDIVEAVDLGQTPGDIVVLSLADSDLAGLAAAWQAERAALPRVRLAHLRDLRHPMSVDLWIDKVGAHAKVIVVRLLGGLDWWKYGIERLAAVARERGIALAVLPGEDRDDARLAAASTLPPPELDILLRYFREGGRENLRALLRRLAGHAGYELAASEPKPVPRVAGYLPGEGAVDLDRLMASLPSKQPVCADHFLPRHAPGRRYRRDRRAVRSARSARPGAGAARRHQPERRRRGRFPARSFRAARSRSHPHHDRVRRRQRRRADAARRTGRHRAAGRQRDDAARGLARQRPRARRRRSCDAHRPARTRRPHPRRHDRLQGSAAAEDGLAFTALASRPEADRVAMVADRVAALARLRALPRSERRVAVLMPDYPGAPGRTGYAVGLDVPASVLALLDDLAAAGYGVSNAPNTSRELLDVLAAGADDAALPLAQYENLLAQIPTTAAARVREALGASRRTIPIAATASSAFASKPAATSWSRCRPTAAARKNAAPIITIRCCRRAMRWSRSACGCAMSRAPMRSFTWARTARWNGCPEKPWR